MNEFLFLIQILFVFSVSLIAFRMGKEALLASITVQALLANFFVLKQILLFGCTVTSSDAFAVGSILGLNLLREYFDTKLAKKATFICFLFMIFFVVMSQLHLFLLPSSGDTAHSAYKQLLTPAPRLLFASLSVFFIVQQFDLRFFGWLKQLFPKTPFFLRNSLSMIISQFLDTILFSFLGLYGLVENIRDIILVSFLIKVFVIFALGPLTILLKNKFPRET